MPRPGELTYYGRIGDEGRRHSVGKPFSDPDCGLYVLRAGALLTLLPPPPARVLDCGCGAGWLSYWLARRGYEVVGTDVSAEAIALARSNPPFRDGPLPSFQVADSEALVFDAEFDAVIFFDSLHHSINDAAVLRSAYRALRSGGVCIALEPGRGHAHKSQAIDAEYDVTDRDMPPSQICRVGRTVGFRRCRVRPAPQQLGKALYAGARPSVVRVLLAHAVLLWQRWRCGIAILYKD